VSGATEAAIAELAAAIKRASHPTPKQWRRELREAQARQQRKSMAITRLLIAGSRGEQFDERDLREAGLPHQEPAL
jgi:hypothetical protein